MTVNNIFIMQSHIIRFSFEIIDEINIFLKEFKAKNYVSFVLSCPAYKYTFMHGITFVTQATFVMLVFKSRHIWLGSRWQQNLSRALWCKFKTEGMPGTLSLPLNRWQASQLTAGVAIIFVRLPVTRQLRPKQKYFTVVYYCTPII